MSLTRTWVDFVGAHVHYKVMLLLAAVQSVDCWLTCCFNIKSAFNRRPLVWHQQQRNMSEIYSTTHLSHVSHFMIDDGWFSGYCIKFTGVRCLLMCRRRNHNTRPWKCVSQFQSWFQNHSTSVIVQCVTTFVFPVCVVVFIQRTQSLNSRTQDTVLGQKSEGLDYNCYLLSDKTIPSKSLKGPLTSLFRPFKGWLLVKDWWSHVDLSRASHLFHLFES